MSFLMRLSLDVVSPPSKAKSAFPVAIYADDLIIAQVLLADPGVQEVYGAHWSLDQSPEVCRILL